MAMLQLESSLTGNHQLVEQRVPCNHHCDKCHEYFHGSEDEGVMCQECGLSWHHTCAKNGLSRCNTHRRNLISAIFGKELSCQFLTSGQSAPLQVLRCINEIETRGASCSYIDLYSVYLSSTTNAILAELTQKLSEDVEHTNLASYGLHSIASVLKKYLRELPNPVFPVQFYDQFIEAAKCVWNKDQCVEVLEQLVHLLPIHHKSTLQTLMAHFCRVCRLQYSRGIKEPPTSLIRVLGRILLKPPWERIDQIVYNINAHIRVVELLLLKGNWGEDMPIFDSAPEVMMLGSSVNISPNSNEYIPPRIEGQKNLNDAEWYWGDIGGDEEYEILKDTPDGTFLVRDAPNKGSAEYILAFSKGGRTNLIKIYHRNGKYSFTEQLDFNSVVELINYYCNVSLAECYQALDVRLLYPISRFHPTGFDEDESLDVENSCEKLMKRNKEYVQKVKLYDQYDEVYEKTKQDVKLKEQAQKVSDANLVIIEQILLEEYLKTATPNGIKRESALNDEELLPHQYENLWFAKYVSTDDVIEILTNKLDGTFLIRNSRTSGQYELSVVADGEVVHCLIYQTDRGYGFAESSNVYPSLKSLVLHYAHNSLEEHNSLKTTLAYPALMSVNQGTNC